MASAHTFDESNPHNEEHHEHVIVPPFTLRAVLAILLFFTVLTVFTAQGEKWAMAYFNVELPRWINVFGAMTIATVKALLVMAFFMQLRYDKAINTLIMIITMFAVALFIFFSGLDLFTRDKIYAEKATVVVPGGTGSGVAGASGSMTKSAKDRWIQKWGPEKFALLEADAHHGHGHGHEEHDGSSANRSVRRVGMSGALSTAAPAAHDDGHGHAAPADPAHAEPDHSSDHAPHVQPSEKSADPATPH